jgi:Kdo2-lipid IVA lauroyltransferase/acyltransferase
MTERDDPILLRLFYALGGAVAWFAYRVLRLRREVIRGNLERSFPEWPKERLLAVEREFARRQGELLAELLYSPWLDEQEMRRRLVFVNPQLILDATPERPVIVVTAHVGNFEWGIQRVSLEGGHGVIGLYKPMRNERLDRWFRRRRSRFGGRLVPAKEVMQEVARGDVAVICIVADQAPTTSPRRHWTRFLGQDTAFYMGPERLARVMRARVVVAGIRRLRRGRYETEFEAIHEPGERLPSGELTERCARALEGWIRDDPPGWWWSHKRWKLSRKND